MITSSCFVYCRANLRARSLASDLQLKYSIGVSNPDVLSFEILVCLAVLFVLLKNRHNWMNVTHRPCSNLHSLGRTAHQNTVHHKKLKYRNCFGNRRLWFGVVWLCLFILCVCVVFYLFGFFCCCGGVVLFVCLGFL